MRLTSIETINNSFHYLGFGRFEFNGNWLGEVNDLGVIEPISIVVMYNIKDVFTGASKKVGNVTANLLTMVDNSDGKTKAYWYAVSPYSEIDIEQKIEWYTTLRYRDHSAGGVTRSMTLNLSVPVAVIQCQRVPNGTGISLSNSHPVPGSSCWAQCFPGVVFEEFACTVTDQNGNIVASCNKELYNGEDLSLDFVVPLNATDLTFTGVAGSRRHGSTQLVPKTVMCNCTPDLNINSSRIEASYISPLRTTYLSGSTNVSSQGLTSLHIVLQRNDNGTWVNIASKSAPADGNTILTTTINKTDYNGKQVRTQYYGFDLQGNIMEEFTSPVTLSF